jgi:TRAP-type C4-dicarboxylate transport system substrate-binding protein
MSERSGITHITRRAFCAGTTAAAFSVVTRSPTHAQQQKSLIDQWLDGEIKANFPPVTYNGPPITIRFSSFITPNSLIVPLFDKAFLRLREATNGKLILRPFWGNTLSNAQRGAFESIAGGVADAGQAYVLFNPGGFTTHLALGLPFLFESSADAAWTTTELYPKYLKKEYEAKGVYLLRVTSTPPQQILTKVPLEKLEDLKGKKIWVPGGVAIDVMRSLGAVPTPLQTSEAYLAFQNNVVDALLTHDTGTKQFRFAELTKYRAVTNLMVSVVETGINKTFFDKLSPDLKQVLVHWAQLWNQVETESYFHDEAKQARAELEQRGVKSTVLSPDELARWKAAAQPAVDSVVNGLEAKGAPAKQFLADVAATAAKWRKRSADEVTKQLLDRPLPGIIDI